MRKLPQFAVAISQCDSLAGNHSPTCGDVQAMLLVLHRAQIEQIRCTAGQLCSPAEDHSKSFDVVPAREMQTL